MSTSPDQHLRKHLVELLDGGAAHLSFDEAVADLPAALRGKRPDAFPHTVWHLVEHLRIAQADILDYIDQSGPELAWPDDYWPDIDAPPTSAAWTQSLKAYRASTHRAVMLAEDPVIDLLKPLPHDEAKTPLRQLLLASDHAAYHIAQVVMVRRMLNAWHD